MLAFQPLGRCIVMYFDTVLLIMREISYLQKVETCGLENLTMFLFESTSRNLAQILHTHSPTSRIAQVFDNSSLIEAPKLSQVSYILCISRNSEARNRERPLWDLERNIIARVPR